MTRFLVSCLLMAFCVSCTPAEQPTSRIQAVELSSLEVARYEELELVIALEAVYGNPHDVRQVDLTAVFTAADGREWVVSDFWDGEDAWCVRFTPPAKGRVALPRAGA